MDLRLAVPRDADDIAQIYAPVVRESAISFELTPPDATEFARRVEQCLQEAPWLVLEDDGRCLGFAYGGRFRGRRAYDWAVETSVYVHADARRRGVARTLYTALLDVLELQGQRTAIGVLTLPNPASVAFHEALGFRATGVVPRAGWKFDAWHDIGFWVRHLGDDTQPPRALMSTAELFADPRFHERLARSAR